MLYPHPPKSTPPKEYLPLSVKMASWCVVFACGFLAMFFITLDSNPSQKTRKEIAEKTVEQKFLSVQSIAQNPDRSITVIPRHASGSFVLKLPTNCAKYIGKSNVYISRWNSAMPASNSDIDKYGRMIDCTTFARLMQDAEVEYMWLMFTSIGFLFMALWLCIAGMMDVLPEARF